MILFLNKTDVFKQKILITPISKRFPDYIGGDDNYELVSQFILNTFLKLNRMKTKPVYSHFTCATDSSNMLFVINAVNDMVVRRNLNDIGLSSYVILTIGSKFFLNKLLFTPYLRQGINNHHSLYAIIY
jgi:guanine nucleotide-binding protein G(i) subunit alpha